MPLPLAACNDVNVCVKHLFVKAYKFKLRPSKRVAHVFEQTLDVCRELYNAGLQERRDAWKLNKVSLNFHSQAIQLPAIKTVREDVDALYSQVTQDALRRLSKAFDAFFRRVKQGQTAKAALGFPRFKAKSRYDSFCYPQSGFKLTGDKLTLAKIGSVRVRLSRAVKGTLKTCTIKHEADGWYVIFTAETCPQLLPPAPSAQVGIDVGLLSFATLSSGKVIDNPRYYREAQKHLRLAQRKVARRKKGSNSRRRAVQLLARVHQHVKCQRTDFHHKLSRWLVNDHQLIAVEDLNIKGLTGGMLAKSVTDAGWGSFLNMIAYKAADAGRQFIQVNPHGTSQTCICGAHTPKTLSQRWHECEACGVSKSRDHVSAQVILQRAGGLPVETLTYRNTESVVSEFPYL